jgi:CheY-like chemotaxis protein/predicted regulator of Ras-like GTPase activity (Roadblock/LC7/MglB family)
MEGTRFGRINLTIQGADSKQLLIVDDEHEILKALASYIGKLCEEYTVDTAVCGSDALEKVKENPYELIITDYMMPTMDGLELAKAVREISPETKVILITAYGSKELRASVSELNLEGFIDKPFSMEQIQTIVEDAIGLVKSSSEEQLDMQGLGEPLRHHLNVLQQNSGASCVLLLSANGYMVESAGVTSGMDTSNISALVAANFAASSELARILKTDSVFKSSFHEGPEYNIYAHDVDGEYLLAVIFGSETKPGAVWHYTKQTAAELVAVIAEQSNVAIDADDLAEAMNAELDQLLDKEILVDIGTGELINFDEAMNAGLVPAELKESDEAK